MTDVRKHWLMHEPHRSMLEHIEKLAVMIYEQTGQHGLKSITLGFELAIRSGIPLGGSITLPTPAGEVEVRCESVELVIRRCSRCGCRLGEFFGQLEEHAPGCPNLPF